MSVHLDSLRKSAKRWLKALRGGDPDAQARFARAYPTGPAQPGLRDVQHAVARELGHESWIALKSSTVQSADAPWQAAAGGHTHAERVATFLQFGCWDHHEHGEGDHRMYANAAARILALHPEIARDSIYTAVVSGDLEEVRRIIAERPESALEPGGARRWTPLLYLCYARLPHQPTIDNAVAIATALLDAGANPNDFYMAGSARYTALVGVAADGEQDCPRQPQSEALFRLLLERGAEPFDIQVLYNTHFRAEMIWWLDIVYAHTTTHGRAEAWADPDWKMFGMDAAAFVLHTARTRRKPELAEWAVAHGAAPSSEQTPPSIDDKFLDVCLRLDRAVALELIAAHPELLRSPKTLFTAAEIDRVDVVELLLDLGVPIEIEDERGQRALHVAAGANALRVARLLIDRGAEVDPREAIYNGTPLQGAAHYWHERMIELLGRHSRDIWNLAYTARVERLRELLQREPELARTVAADGTTPLWWLPHDEARALEIVELLIAHGADPAARSTQGRTAADWALKMGMPAVAARLGVTTEPPSATSEIERYETLAKDLTLAFDSGDGAALQRLSQHYNRTVTRDDVYSDVWQAFRTVREAKARPGSFTLDDAKDHLAHQAGFSSWPAFAEALVSGAPPPGPPAVVDAKENRLRPQRALNAGEWETVAAFMKVRRIAALDAAGQITDEALDRISRLEHVTALNLGGSRYLTDAGLMHLARMPQLEELDLSHYPGGLITDRGLEVLRHLPALRKFAICWQPGITDAGVANLGFCPNLEDVNLMGTQTGDSAIRALAGKQNLRKFNTGRHVTDEGLAALHHFPNFKTWQGGEAEYSLMGGDAPTHLMIDGPFTNAGLASLVGLDGLAGLSLFWHVSELTADALAPLKGLANLGMLGVDGKLCDDTAMQHIAAFPRLQKLNAQGTVATDEGFAALSRSASIAYIWGRECPNLTGRGFAALAQMPALRGLAVSCRRVDDAALALLPRFPALTALLPMDVQDAGFRHVGACANLENLWCMYCRDTTDAATEHLAGLRRLKTYYAGATQITDRSLEILGGISSLEKIEVYECKGITDAGLRFLAALPNLREIGLDGDPNVTLAGTALFPAGVRVNYSV
jgi:hypothetical protein